MPTEALKLATAPRSKVAPVTADTTSPLRGRFQIAMALLIAAAGCGKKVEPSEVAKPGQPEIVIVDGQQITVPAREQTDAPAGKSVFSDETQKKWAEQDRARWIAGVKAGADSHFNDLVSAEKDPRAVDALRARKAEIISAATATFSEKYAERAAGDKAAGMLMTAPLEYLRDDMWEEMTKVLFR